MKTFSSPEDLKVWRESQSQTLGFVPTMGALHDGHLSLIRKAKEQCSLVVVSVFINPTQFNNKSDLEKYPRNLDSDLILLKENGVDAVFLPTFESIYPDNYKYKVCETSFSNKLCGAHRPGHFDGVLTVVMKLFQIVAPNKAYFGLKDYQQFQLIQNMKEAFFLPIDIIGLETIREKDGLALSSRNLLLSPDSREKAPLLYKVLKESKNLELARKDLELAGFRVDYLEEHENRRFAAAFLDNVRLIDNVEVEARD